MMTKQIPLTQGKFALVDDEDFAYLMQWNWYAHKSRNTFYALRHEGKGVFSKTIFMHRVITGAASGLEVDHLSGNGLNNTRSNLRICNHTENRRNSRKQKDNTSGFKGVTFHKRAGKFMAKIKVNGKDIYLGLFRTAEEAARARDEKARELFGEFAYLNFPK